MRIKVTAMAEEHLPEVVTTLCGLFISVYDSRLSFIHQTARESSQIQTTRCMARRLNMPDSHSTLSLVCLHYLMLPDIENQSSFLPYSAANWPSHYISQPIAVADQAGRTLVRSVL